MISNLSPRLQGILLLLIAAALFWPGLGGDFVFDDYHNIVNNERVHATHLDYETLRKAAGAYDLKGGLQRPLATVWFAVDYRLGGGTPWIFKFNGLLVHLFNALLIFLLLRRLFEFPSIRLTVHPAGQFTCVFLALIWAIHPLQVSAVLYVVQRMETLSLSFVLLGLCAYLAGRRRQIEGTAGWPYLLACLPLLVLSLLTKESAALFPAYTLALEFTVLGFAAQRRSSALAWRGFYVVGCALALLLFVFWAIPHFATTEAYAIRNFTLAERLLTQCRVLPMYIGQILMPLPTSMTFYYDDYPLSHSLFDPITTILGALFLLALVGSAIAFRKRMPLYALGILWFFAAHLLTSNVVAFELIFEHRNYFALIGILLAVYDLVTRIPFRERVVPWGTVAMLLLFGLGVLTLLRAATWGDPFLLATDIIAKRPGSSRARSDLAALYFEASHDDPKSRYFEEAMREFDRSARLPNSSAVPEYSMIVMSLVVSNTADDSLWLRLIEKIRTRAKGPEALMSINGLLEQSELGRGVNDKRLAQAYILLLAGSKQQVPIYVRCGAHALFMLKDEKLAEQLLLKAIALSPRGSSLPKQIHKMVTDAGSARLAEVIASAIKDAAFEKLQ